MPKVFEDDDYRPYICGHPGCEAAFKRSHDLFRHSETHNRERKYACDVLGCTFSCHQAAALRTHRYVHTGEKPFVCPVCGRAFGDPASCSRHKKRLHSELLDLKPSGSKKKATAKKKKSCRSRKSSHEDSSVTIPDSLDLSLSSSSSSSSDSAEIPSLFFGSDSDFNTPSPYPLTPLDIGAPVNFSQAPVICAPQYTWSYSNNSGASGTPLLYFNNAAVNPLVVDNSYISDGYSESPTDNLGSVVAPQPTRSIGYEFDLQGNGDGAHMGLIEFQNPWTTDLGASGIPFMAEPDMEPEMISSAGGLDSFWKEKLQRDAVPGGLLDFLYNDDLF